MHNKVPLIFIIFGYAFLYIPIFSLILYSFSASQYPGVWEGWSLRWYGDLLKNSDLLRATWISAQVAALSATSATLLGTLCALVLVKIPTFKGKSFLRLLVTAPLMTPEVITGVSFFFLFLNIDRMTGLSLGGGLFALTVAHTTLSVAYVTAIIYSQLGTFDDALLEAAMDLGATPFRAFLSITLPILAPSLLSGWLLAFVLSLDDVVLSAFVAGPAFTTLPMAIYSSVRFGATPQINALATLIIFFISVCLALAGFLQLKQMRAQK